MTSTPRSPAPPPHSKLQDSLDEITARTRQLVQEDRLAISERSTAQLFATGIERQVLAAGALMPEFALEDARTGKLVQSADLLALGPLVITFFRGRWCPYCTTELETWRNLLPELRRRGALLVAISPQTRRQNAFMADQLFREASSALGFPILGDPASAVAERFGLVYTVPPPDRAYFRSILVNIPFANSGLSYDRAPDSAWRLPLPGTFLVRPDGIVDFAEAHADFRVRPEPAEVLDRLAAITR